jgi:spermidine synthase
LPLHTTDVIRSAEPHPPSVSIASSRDIWLLPTLSLFFFCSGACALTYQVLWLRLLGLVFGVTTYAASTVWASFMAGLAIGSLIAGRLADRVRRPLAWFGATELLIGGTALATPMVLGWLQQAYVQLYPSLADSLPSLTFARFAIAFAVLIIPTVMMGATFPLVVKSSALRTMGLGERIGVFYGTNTAGAIVGTLASGLYLIPQWGIHGTFLFAAAVNMIVGIGALAAAFAAPLTNVLQPDDASMTAQSLGVVAGDQMFDVRRLWIILIVFAVSGFTSLALEVVWFRVLTLFLRPTVYGFAVMLASVLAGIAIGSYLLTPFLDRRIKWVALLASLEFAIALATLSSFALLVRMNDSTVALTPLLSQVMHEWLVFPTVGSLQAVFPTALLMGAAFPIGLRLWSSGGREETRAIAQRIGFFYSVNVAGSILGALLGGFFLLPLLGSRRSIIALATISFGSGLLLLAVSEWRRTVRVFVGGAATVVFALGVWRSPEPFDEFVAQRYPRQRVVWREEGVEATVVVHARGDELTLSVNGNHQASTGRAMTYGHRLIGHLPMILHPDARSALVIGMGGGATAGAVSIHDGVDVDVVELAGAVIRGARFFETINYGLLTRPNVHVRVDDGRNYLLLTQRKYDVVTADVIHPIYAGSGNLYSAEYFRLIRQALKPGGIAVQWVAGTEAEYKLIARTFLSVFPQTTVWTDGTLLVGSLEPLQIRRADFERKLQVPGRAQGAQDAGATSFDRLLAMYRAGPDELRAFVGSGAILTDDRPLVEYFLSLPRDREIDLSPLKGDVRRHVVEE